MVKKFPLKILWIGLLIAGGWFSNLAYGQIPVIKTSVDKNEILIGQQIRYRVEVSFPQNKYLLKWFSFPDKMNGFEVVSREEIDTSTNSGLNTFGQTMILTNFDSGRRYVPALVLEVLPQEEGKPFTMLTDSILVNVKHSPLDSIQPFHDIKSIIEVKDEWEWWRWAIMIAGIILLISGLAWIIKRMNKKKEATELPESKVPPYEEAIDSLEALEKEQLLEKGQVKEYHVRLSNIFKRYLSRKMKANKMHLTTDLLLIDLNTSGLDKDQMSVLANSLYLGNAVKFAQFIPPAYQSVSCMQVIKQNISDINHLIDKKEPHAG